MKWRIPSKDYARQYRELLPELLPELERVLLEEEPVLGASVERFERDWAAYVGVRHAVALNSGTDALWLALRALGVGPGDEVITPANNFIAAATAIVLCGAKPVLVEPEQTTLLLDIERTAVAITPRTKAIVPVHLYGAFADPAPLQQLCRERGVALIEDAAQAHGARVPIHAGSSENAKKPGQSAASFLSAGAIGRAGCFSFHPSKNLGAFGDGGCVTTDDESLARRVRELRHLGKPGEHEAVHVATNTKLDTLQAALLRLKLPELDASNARRKALAAIYRRELAGIGDLVLPEVPHGGDHVFHLFVVRSARRDELQQFLATRGIKASVHYPIPLHLQPALRSLGHRVGDFPIAEEAARTVLSLPIAPELTDGEIGEVAAALRDFFRR